MDIVYFLVSINKISLIAFLGTLCFLGYEIYLFRKEKQKKSSPTIPKFDEKTVQSPGIKSVTIAKEEEKTFLRPNNTMFIVLVVFLILFGIFALLGFVNGRKQLSNEQTISNSLSRVEFTTSKGIRIFFSDFQPLGEDELSRLKEGVSLIIGVETIKEADIDRARIRVNSQSWDTQDITNRFNTRYNVFYREYRIASGSSNLKIEAELHSKQDGWLGE